MGRWRIGACVLALCVTGLIGSVPALGASTASLQRQINQLKARVSHLERDIEDLYACQTVIPVSVYGDSDGHFGYWWSPDGGISEYLTTALDLVPDTSGWSPDEFWWVTVVDDSCVSSARAAWKPAPRLAMAGKAASLQRVLR
ncbi:MAG: hypothetical protein U0R69_08010 [Gaiellales bacterium]